MKINLLKSYLKKTINPKLDEANDLNVEVGEEDDSKPGRGVPVKRGAHPNAVNNYYSQDLYNIFNIELFEK